MSRFNVQSSRLGKPSRNTTTGNPEPGTLNHAPKMYMQDDVRNSLDAIISSYEDRIKSVESTYDNIFQIFHTFQTSFIDAKQEQEQTNTQLRENLARNGSLRKKDFDNMMQDVLKTQDEREEAVKGLLNAYLNEQYKMASLLRKNLSEVRGALAKGEVEKIKEFKGLIRSLLDEQESKKEEITSSLKEFQKEQQRVATGIKALLAKGNELRIRDFKKMLKEIELQNKERIAHTRQRRHEVRDMLAGFEAQRLEGLRKAENRVPQNKEPQMNTDGHRLREAEGNVYE